MATKKLKRYKTLKIERDCLVPKGAMQVKSIFKEDGAFILEQEPLVKFDDEKQIMYNVMLLFNKADSQNMILDNETLRNEALMDFHKNGDKILKFSHFKDENKEPFEIDAHVLEVYIAKENDPMYPDYVGSIIRSAYFNDKEDFEIAKTLEFESSIEGFAQLEEVDTGEDEEENKDELEKARKKFKIKDLVKKIFNIEVSKDFDTQIENKTNNDLWTPVYAFENAIYDAQWKYILDKKDKGKFVKEIKKICNQFVKYVDGMSFEVIEKEINKNKGEDMATNEEILAMVKEEVNKALGLEDGKTIADLVKEAIGEQKPSELPVVKDKDGNEINLGDIIKSNTETISELSGKLDKATETIETQKSELDEIKKQLTDNPENPDGGEDDEVKKQRLEKEKSKTTGLL